MANKFKLFPVLLLGLFLAYPALVGAVTPPLPAQPAQYVVDLAGVLDAGAQTRLNTVLKDLEAETTAQVMVLTIHSLDGEPIESFSHQTAVKWGIGQKGKDNGVLLTVAVKDHKYRLEVGYGLESVLPDSLVGGIGREYLAPNFRKGDYAGGITAAVTEIINKLTQIMPGEAASHEAEPSATTTETVSPSETKTPPRLILLAIIIFVLVLLPAIALILPRIIRRAVRGKGSSGGIWFSGGGSSGSSSSWGGGDSSGFSSGGGDFGGGGASGDW